MNGNIHLLKMNCILQCSNGIVSHPPFFFLALTFFKPYYLNSIFDPLILEYSIVDEFCLWLVQGKVKGLKTGIRASNNTLTSSDHQKYKVKEVALSRRQIMEIHYYMAYLMKIFLDTSSRVGLKYIAIENYPNTNHILFG